MLTPLCQETRPLDTYVVEATGCTQVHLAKHIKVADTSTQHNTDIYFGGALYPPETYYEISDRAYFSSVRDALDRT